MTQISKEQTTPAAKSTDSQKEFSLISNGKLLQIYAAMVQCRMIEERAELLFTRRKLRYNLRISAGREASAAAVCDLQREDGLSLTDGDLVPCFVKGVRPESLFRALADMGNDLTNDAMLNILMPSTVEAQTKSIREFALHEKDKKTGRIAVAFLAKEADSQAQWQETMSFAGTKSLPVVFIRHGVLHAEHHDSAAEERGNAAANALANGIPAIVVDGGDAVALYRVTCEAIARARQGRGPTLVECFIFNGFDPAGDGKNKIYKGSVPPAADPISGMESYLKRKNLWSDQTRQRIVDDFHRELDLATRFLND